MLTKTSLNNLSIHTCFQWKKNSFTLTCWWWMDRRIDCVGTRFEASKKEHGKHDLTFLPSHSLPQLSVKLRCKVRLAQLLKNILVVALLVIIYYRNSLFSSFFLPFHWASEISLLQFYSVCSMKANHFNNIKFLNHSSAFIIVIIAVRSHIIINFLYFVG